MEIYCQLGSLNRYSQGAIDNASGVSVLLALAEYFSINPPDKINLGFLFTTAEETGLHGSTTFAASLNPHDQVALLNFDMVGAGKQVRYITMEGTLITHRTSAKMNQLIQLVNPKARGLWYSRRSGDYLPFLNKKIQATSIQTSGNAIAELSYHTIHDTINLIQESTLESVSQTAIAFVQRFRDIKF